MENQPKPDRTPLVYFASDAPAAGFDCDRDAFIGSYRSEEAPIGLEHAHLKNSTLFGGDPCFALELPLTLRAGETKSINIYLGTEMTEDEIFKATPHNSASCFSGSFPPILRFEKFEIHTVFLHFSNLDLTKNLSLNQLAELCGVALELWRKYAS